ncbi:hypothetical protein S245_047820, partial [Arachis hypogaea]
TPALSYCRVVYRHSPTLFSLSPASAPSVSRCIAACPRLVLALRSFSVWCMMRYSSSSSSSSVFTATSLKSSSGSVFPFLRRVDLVLSSAVQGLRV